LRTARHHTDSQSISVCVSGMGKSRVCAGSNAHLCCRSASVGPKAGIKEGRLAHSRPSTCPSDLAPSEPSYAASDCVCSSAVESTRHPETPAPGKRVFSLSVESTRHPETPCTGKRMFSLSVESTRHPETPPPRKRVFSLSVENTRHPETPRPGKRVFSLSVESIRHPETPQRRERSITSSAPRSLPRSSAPSPALSTIRVAGIDRMFKRSP